MANNIVLPLDKVVRAVERGFPTDGIFCTLNDFDKFSEKIISLAYNNLQREGEVSVCKRGIRYSISIYEEALRLNSELEKEIPDINKRARQMLIRLKELDQTKHLVSFPNYITIIEWIKGRTKPLKYSGSCYLEWYLRDVLKIASPIRSVLYYRRWPLNVLLFVAHEICEISPKKIEEQIATMWLRRHDKGINVLKALFDSERALSSNELIRSGIISSRTIMGGLVECGYLAKRIRHGTKITYFTVVGDEQKFNF